MFCKIKVHCHHCKCSSELTSEYSANKLFSCPNCGNTMDPDLYMTLCNALTAIKEIPAVPYGWEDDTPRFSFTLCAEDSCHRQDGPDTPADGPDLDF